MAEIRYTYKYIEVISGDTIDNISLDDVDRIFVQKLSNGMSRLAIVPKKGGAIEYRAPHDKIIDYYKNIRALQMKKNDSFGYIVTIGQKLV